MNRAEFDEWFRDHTACFRSLSDWFAKLGAQRATETVDAWFRVLRRLDLEDAKRATELLFDGTETEPKSRDKIPAAVAAISRRLASRRRQDEDRERWRSAGDETVACLACNDSGSRLCWHPATMQAAADGRFPGDPTTCDGAAYCVSVPCTCKAGDHFGRQLGYRFDPEKWCEIAGTRYDEDERWQLVEFVRQRVGVA